MKVKREQIESYKIHPGSTDRRWMVRLSLHFDEEIGCGSISITAPGKTEEDAIANLQEIFSGLMIEICE